MPEPKQIKICYNNLTYLSHTIAFPNIRHPSAREHNGFYCSETQLIYYVWGKKDFTQFELHIKFGLHSFSIKKTTNIHNVMHVCQDLT